MKKPPQGAKQQSVTAVAYMGGHPKPHRQRHVTGSGPVGRKGGGTKHKPPRKHKTRGWSPGWDVACCSAEALGFLLGWDHGRVLDLYWRTAADPDEGATIEDTLAACVPALRAVVVLPPGAKPDLVVPELPAQPVQFAHGLILGVSLPEPHAIAVTPDGTWHSWGEPFHPAGWPELVIGEAWAVLA